MKENYVLLMKKSITSSIVVTAANVNIQTAQGFQTAFDIYTSWRKCIDEWTLSEKNEWYMFLKLWIGYDYLLFIQSQLSFL